MVHGSSKPPAHWPVLLAGSGAAVLLGTGIGASLAVGWGVAPEVATATGAGLAIAGLSATWGMVQSMQSDWMRKRLTRLERLIDDNEAMVGGLRGSVEGLHERLDSSPSASGGDVRAELKVLQELLSQVVTRRETGAATAAGATPPRAGAATRPSRVEPDVAVPVSAPDAHALAIMKAALVDSRVDLYLQPVVRLPSRKVAHYEAFSRVRGETGEVVFPNDYLRPAEGAGLVATLDNLLLFRCVNLVRQLGPRRPGTRIFVNLSPGSLHDSAFLREFVGFMRQNRMLASRLVFEVAADDLPRFAPQVQEQLEALAGLGFAFSIDRVSSLDIDTGALHGLNVQYVKIDSRTLLESHGAVRREDLKALLARHTIELIATHIETERTVVEILDLGIDYGQGYLFGEPRPARNDLPDSRAA